MGDLSGSFPQRLSESLTLVWLPGSSRPPYCTTSRTVIHSRVDGPGFRTVALSLGSSSLPGTSEVDNCQFEFATEFHPPMTSSVIFGAKRGLTQQNPMIPKVWPTSTAGERTPRKT